MAESEEELKSLFMRVKEESERANLRVNINYNNNNRIIASGPITAWQIEGEMVEVLTSFLFLGSKISVDGDCSHGIREGLFSRKEMKNLVSVSKSRDITLPTKVGILKAMVFLVVTYICES